jgi:hypothetical protein
LITPTILGEYYRSLHSSHQDIHIWMKSITKEHCSLHYTCWRNCSSTTNMKLTTTQQHGLCYLFVLWFKQ